ncbi:MAG: S8 family serine peptidase [Candidatus Saliniplasma sp.]
MRKKIRMFVGIFIVIMLLTSVFVGMSLDTIEDDDIDIVLARTSEQNDLEYLESTGGNVLHVYDSFTLVEIDLGEISRAESRGIAIDRIEDRTTLEVGFGQYEFDIEDGEPEISKELRIDGYESGEKGQYLIHMLGPIASEWRTRIEDQGVEVMNYVPNYAYRVRMTPDQAERVEDLDFVDWTGIYHPEYKIQPDLEMGRVNIRSLQGSESDEIYEILGLKSQISSIDTETGEITAEVSSRETLHDLVRSNDVIYIRELSERKLQDEMSTQIVGGGAYFFDDEDGDPDSAYRLHGNYGSYMNQLGYKGKDVVIGIADGGLGGGSVSNVHSDFQDRVLGGYSYEGGWEDHGSGHGSHTAGSIAADTYAGSGSTVYNDYYSGQGSAPSSELYVIKIFGDGGSWIGPEVYVYDIIEKAKDNADAVVHSNSWGGLSHDSSYDPDSHYYDAAARGEDMAIVCAAGNQGVLERVMTPATGKNVVAVGATETYNPDEGASDPQIIAGYSSRGWTNDNRVKPDVVGPGDSVTSTGINSGYEVMSGTSMSTPAVSGAAGVVVEWYKDMYGEKPSPALVKSILINTAIPLDPNAGNTEGTIPNRMEGWGSVDISKLERPLNDPVPFNFFDQERIFDDSGQTEDHLVSIDRTDEPIKFSLTWTDKEAPGDTGNGPTLINDLDLEVISPSGDVYRGNAFAENAGDESTRDYTYANTDTMSLFDNNEDGWDDTNNVENVYIPQDEVEPGAYTVRIEARNIADDAIGLGYNSQDYGLTVYNAQLAPDGEAPSVNINSPDGGEVWDARTEEDIHWSITAGDDPIDRIDLAYSINDGDSWTPIIFGLDDIDSYKWTVPNEDSSECLVRVRAIDTAGRWSENISTDLFQIIGIPPASSENNMVNHIQAYQGELFADDVEGGDIGYTTGTNDPEASEWDIRQNDASSGVNSWDWGDDNFNSKGPYLSWLISPEITIPDNVYEETGLWLTFQHWYDFGAANRHGGNVKISTEGVNGPWTLIYPEEHYTGTMDTREDNPIGGEKGYVSSSDWTNATFDLTDYIGETIHIRWNAGTSDHSDVHEGWRIDDISIEGLILDSGEDEDNLLTWNPSPDEGIDEVSHYNIYRSGNQNGPWDETTLIGNVSVSESDEYMYVDLEKGMIDDTHWWYVIRAVGDNGLEEDNTDAFQEPGEGPPFITFNSPTADDTWQGGTQKDITWTTTEGDDPVDCVDLWYSSEGGTSWISIAENLDDTGSYTWTVPNVHTSEAVLRATVSDTGGRQNYNTSDTFEILGIPPESPENLAVEHYGTYSETLFEDDVEGGDLGYTTGRSHDEASDWDIRQNDAASGDDSWDFGDGDFNTDRNKGMLSWLISPEITIPEEVDEDYGVNMTFQQWYGFGSFDRHGGNVKISTDGVGGPWSLLVPEEGYDGTVSSSDNPLSEETAYLGSSDWTTATFDLTSYIGETVHIRWDAGTADTLSSSDGWRIDDIQVETQMTDGDSNNIITWNSSLEDPDGVSHYNLYRSEDSSGPWDDSNLIDQVDADGSAGYSYIDVDKGKADNTYWWYVIRAVSVDGAEEQNTNAVPEPGAETSLLDISLTTDTQADDWNFVSFNLIPEDTSLTAILDDTEHGISGSYDKVMYYDAETNEWQSYIPGRAGHFNSLDTWDHTMGVWIQMNADDTLTVEGYEPTSTDITLQPGWNMVSYPSSTAGNNGLPAEVDMIGYFDASAPYNIAYDHDPGTFTFEPGQGYWIHNPLDTGITWTVDY